MPPRQNWLASNLARPGSASFSSPLPTRYGGAARSARNSRRSSIAFARGPPPELGKDGFAGSDAVDAVAAPAEVGAAAAVERNVVTVLPEQVVVAGFAEEIIGAIAAPDAVAARSAIGDVVAIAAAQD